MRLALDTEFSANSKILEVTAFTVLELLIGTKKNCKIWIGKQGNCKPSMDSVTQRQM